MKPTLSILTPTIPSRAEKLARLAEKLAKQAEGRPVEHLILSDNRARSIGGKRQALVDIARGDYFAFVDDDDDVSDAYVSQLLGAASTGADVITFSQRAVVNGHESTVVFRADHRDCPFNVGGITLRAPWHVCCWRKAAVKDCRFGLSNYGEDLEWCVQARKRAETSFHIDAALHEYHHDAQTTAAPVPV